MKRTRKDVGSALKFAVLSFNRADDDEALTDAIVQAAKIEEKLRTVTKIEFDAYRRDVLKDGNPDTPLAAFGAKVRGPEDNGGFVGVPYLDVDGEFKVEEDWTRGNKGDQWNGEWEFLFVPIG